MYVVSVMCICGTSDALALIKVELVGKRDWTIIFDFAKS